MTVQQKITVKLPRKFSDSARRQAGKLIIKLIKDRTSRGLDKNNNAFVGYSKSYKESKDFDIAGKSSLVNLRLSGEMMNSLEILGSGTGFVTIGFPSGSEVNDKASFAKDFGNGPSRPFLGVNATELKQIVSSIDSDELGANVRGLLEGSGFNIFDFIRINE